MFDLRSVRLRQVAGAAFLAVGAVANSAAAAAEPPALQEPAARHEEANKELVRAFLKALEAVGSALSSAHSVQEFDFWAPVEHGTQTWSS